MYYGNEFKHVSIVIDKCTQRYCFIQSHSLKTNKKTTTLQYEDGCSPVMIHKGYPQGWEEYYPLVSK